MAGYSGASPAKKLGIKPGDAIYLMGAPAEYRDWIGKLPDGAAYVARPSKDGTAVVHLFVKSIAELEKQLPAARHAMKTDGMLWVSWTKKSAKVPTDVTEDEIRKHALKTDLVDVKVCAVTDLWSGLKLVVRKHLR